MISDYLFLVSGNSQKFITLTYFYLLIVSMLVCKLCFFANFTEKK